MVSKIGERRHGFRTHPIGNECGFNAAGKGVNHHANGEQEARSISVDTCHSREDCRASDQQIDGGDQLIDQTISTEHDMCRCSVADFGHLKKCLGIWGSAFKLDGSNGEEQNLYTCSCAILYIVSEIEILDARNESNAKYLPKKDPKPRKRSRR